MNSSTADGAGPVTPHGDFADRLREIGDRIAIGADDPGLDEIRNSLAARRRRRRILPIAAAAVVAGTALTAAFVATRTDDGTLTVSSEPTREPDDSVGAEPAAGGDHTTPTSEATSPGTTAATPPTSSVGTDAGSRAIDTTPAEAAVNEAQQPPIIDATPEDVTELVPHPEQVRPEGLPDDISYEVSYEWIVEWRGGFLLGRESQQSSGELDVHLSPDGRSWDPIDIKVPADLGHVDDIVSTGDRLALLSSRWDGQRNQPVLWSTTDLTEWTQWTMPSPEPADGFPASVPVFSQALGVDVAANDEGWAVQVRGDVEIDVFALAERYVDDATAVDSIGSSFDGETLTLDIGVGDEETTVEIDVSEDLGLDEAQARTLEVGPYNEMWIGAWGDPEPARVTDLPPGSFQGVVASEDAVAGWTSTHIGVTGNGDDRMRVFATRPAVAERSSISAVYADGTQFIVHANAPSAAATFDRLDPRTGEWTPLELGPLPATVRAAYGASGNSAVLNPQSLPGSVPTRSSIEVGDYRYVVIYDQPFTTYELRRLDTSEVVVTETVDIRNGSDPRAPGWRPEHFDRLDLRVTDPATGEVLVDLTDEQAEELLASETTLDGSPAPGFTVADFTPIDDWAASVSNGTWLLHDLPDPKLDENGNPRRSAFGLIARSGDVLLVETGDAWLRFDLDVQ